MSIIHRLLSLLQGQEDTSLPPRLRGPVAQLEDQSERLISWLQLGIVTIFAVLYSFAPKTFMVEDVPFQPVPIALSVYFVLTVIRVIWAHVTRIPRWALVISVFFDMALLMGLIWSFHVQYGQPAAFYLKAPTVLYVFIFIVLRAMRFDWTYVVIAGAAAGFGWACLVGYALMEGTDGELITRDYVEYMTSNMILRGAEADKIITILMVSGILAFAIARARGLLVKAVAEEVEKRELSRFFAPEVVERIAQSDSAVTAGEGEARDAAILMIDIRGFTQLGNQLRPAELIGLLSEYQHRLVPGVQAHNGSIDKFLGDGLIATFGAAMPSERYAAEALGALDAVLEAVDEWNTGRWAHGQEPIKVGAAVAHGRVIFGAVGFGGEDGAQGRLEFTVIGDPVNLAAKLEKANKALGTRGLTTEQCFDDAVRQGYAAARSVEHLPTHSIEGWDRPLDLVVMRRQ